jgi:hypothetical protein
VQQRRRPGARRRRCNEGGIVLSRGSGRGRVGQPGWSAGRRSCLRHALLRTVHEHAHCCFRTAPQEAEAKAAAQVQAAAAAASKQQQAAQQLSAAAGAAAGGGTAAAGGAKQAAPTPSPAPRGDCKAAPGALEWERHMAEKLSAAERAVADLVTKPELKAQRRQIEKKVTLIVSQISGTQQQVGRRGKASAGARRARRARGDERAAPERTRRAPASHCRAVGT